jgi:hypothetical protein
MDLDGVNLERAVLRRDEEDVQLREVVVLVLRVEKRPYLVLAGALADLRVTQDRQVRVRGEECGQEHRSITSRLSGGRSGCSRV